MKIDQIQAFLLASAIIPIGESEKIPSFQHSQRANRADSLETFEGD